jgi:hypothetical protein
LGVPVLLAGSKKYQAKFNADEVKIIDKIIKKNSMTANYFIRQCVIFTVEQAQYEKIFQENKEAQKWITAIWEESAKIMNDPRNLKLMERKLEGKISQKSLDKLETDANELQKEVEILRKKKKPGRKRIIKKRGRPKA